MHLGEGCQAYRQPSDANTLLLVNSLKLNLLFVINRCDMNMKHRDCCETLIFQAHYSTGRVAAGFTSTAMAPETAHEAGMECSLTQLD